MKCKITPYSSVMCGRGTAGCEIGHGNCSTAKEGPTESELSDLFNDVISYLESRKKTITASIASEKLAGNESKEIMEVNALLEVTAIETFINMRR